MGEITWREGTGEPTSTRTVRHDSFQYLSDPAKRQARTNIGTGSGSDMYATVRLFNAGELVLDDSLIIGGQVYTMVATPTMSGEVLGEAGMQPIIDAINDDALNAPHALVMASDAGGGDMLIRALVEGSEGNGILVDLSTTYGTSASWEEGATSGGTNSLLADTLTWRACRPGCPRWAIS